MLDINPELVCNIIQKIREFQSKEEVVIPEDASNDIYSEDFSQILANHKDDLTYQEVKLAIEDLEPDQQQCLMALALVGRGDYDIKDW